MAAQKGFVAVHGVFAFAGFSAVQFCQPVNEAEFRAVRQKVQGCIKIVHFVAAVCDRQRRRSQSAATVIV